ncbi:hypothetical protein PI124_g10232 [Phytophthora idaei]|nr:hypothetical protein PI125_g18067 [Phytophthora idaei]KAG3155529.1 hypothetical protein PI126_g9139 [Phytophthora idaei]KAG3245023.1 hypothetical protein PI124_g10232 [Phytophthora idaei]
MLTIRLEPDEPGGAAESISASQNELRGASRRELIVRREGYARE